MLEASLADCRTVVLPDRGHSVLVEATTDTYALVRDWLLRQEAHTLREAL
jgi:dipeptidyl aminopeptidase/acylaminoacyl peptidase